MEVIEVAKDNISVNSLAFAAIDIPGDMIWQSLTASAVMPGLHAHDGGGRA